MTRCTCSSVARSCITTTICTSLQRLSFRRPVLLRRVRDPLESSRFVDDPFEQPLHRLIVQWPHVDPLDVTEHLRFARRLVDLQPGELFLVTDLERARGAFVQELDEPLVERIDFSPQFVEAHTAPFSQRTYSPARGNIRRRAVVRNHLHE